MSVVPVELRFGTILFCLWHLVELCSHSAEDREGAVEMGLQCFGEQLWLYRTFFNFLSSLVCETKLSNNEGQISLVRIRL